jgi:hypothetical protein
MQEPFRSFPPDERIEPDADAVEEWLLWEEQANLVGFRTSTQPFVIPVAWVPRARVEVHLPPHAPEVITERFLRGDHVAFPRHPLNRDTRVSFWNEPSQEIWLGRFTSSRTLVVSQSEDAPLFSLKLSTDHPHPDFLQPEKTELREEARDAISWVALLDRVDALLAPDPRLRMVREALAVLVPGTAHGFLVRDLRLFRDGGHYLPALSIPWVGRQIARRHGCSFETFWGRHYAAAAGRAKAILFVRTGLQFETPNPQNVLVRLDANLHPSGCIVMRDLGDANCATDALECRETPWRSLRHDVRPETHNSFWAFGEAGDHSVDAATLAAWYECHERAYFEVLAASFPALAPAAGLDPAGALAHWNAALRDPACGRTIAAGFAQMARRPPSA